MIFTVKTEEENGERERERGRKRSKVERGEREK